MKCECGEDMTIVEVPAELLCFRIPLIGYEVRLWHYQDELQCHWCDVAKHHDERSLEIDAAYDSGYEKGWKERDGDATC